jgi:hypothetical protein
MPRAADKRIGCLRLAIVAVTTAGLVGLGIGIGVAHRPFEGRPCSLRNATSSDATGRTMWCNPTMNGNHDVVWQYAPAA